MNYAGTSQPILPRYLKAGSTIGITCPAGYVPTSRILYPVELLKKWGFNVVIGNTIDAGGDLYFAGSDAERMADLQRMMDDPNIDAILMGRGGYGMSRIVDGLDFTKFLQKPKWFCGFSDGTVMHSHLQASYNISSLHSPLCVDLKPEAEYLDHIQQFRTALSGGALTYTTPISPYNRAGDTTATITGGNLSLLAHLTGSISEADTDGKILFIEDIDEHLYHVDRMLLNLKRAGKLAKLAGLLVGQFTKMQDTTRPFGQTIEEIIFDKVKEYNFPVCFNFPAGHDDINYTITLGVQHKLSVTAAGGKLELIR